MANLRDYGRVIDQGVSLYGATNPGTGFSGALNQAGGYAALAAPLLLGMFGMPSGRAKIDALKKARHDRMAAKAIRNIDTGGMSLKDYTESRRPPKSPWDYAMDGIPDTDDGNYERQQMANYFTNGEGKAKMEAFWQANPEWYTSDGKRIYQNQDDADAIQRMAPSGIVDPLTQGQKDAMKAIGLKFDDKPKTGVLPPVAKKTGALAVEIPDRPRWLQENAPLQAYNGQELYDAVKRYTPNNYWSR